jgi:hypothetical protein
MKKAADADDAGTSKPVLDIRDRLVDAPAKFEGQITRGDLVKVCAVAPGGSDAEPVRFWNTVEEIHPGVRLVVVCSFSLALPDGLRLGDRHLIDLRHVWAYGPGDDPEARGELLY